MVFSQHGGLQGPQTLPHTLVPKLQCVTNFLDCKTLAENNFVGDQTCSILTEAVEDDSIDESSVQFKCARCMKGFECKPSLNEHLVSHEIKIMEESLACSFCDEKFISVSDIEAHSKVHFAEDYPADKRRTGRKIWRCLKCQEEFSERRSVEWHAREHHLLRTENKRECLLCGKLFLIHDKVGYKTHMKSHAKYGTSYQSIRASCPLCPKVLFTNFGDRQEHASRFHDGKFHVKCAKCPQVFENETERVEHETRQHPAIQPQPVVHEKSTCTYCGRSIIKEKMEEHIKSVHGERTFICDKV